MEDKVGGSFRVLSSRALNGVGQVVVVVARPDRFPFAEYYVFLAGPRKAFYSGRLKVDRDVDLRNLEQPGLDDDAAMELALTYVRIRWPEILDALFADGEGPPQPTIELEEEPSPEKMLEMLHLLGFRDELNSIKNEGRCRPLQILLDRQWLKAGLVEEREFHLSGQ